MLIWTFYTQLRKYPFLPRPVHDGLTYSFSTFCVSVRHSRRVPMSLMLSNLIQGSLYVIRA